MGTETPSAIIQILTGLMFGPPIWVWPLLVVLLFVGWRATKVRRTSMTSYYFLPLMGLLTVQSVSSLPQAGLAWVAFGLCYCAGVVMSFQMQSRWVLQKSKGVLRLAGEWVTMGAVMVVFWTNFVRGVLLEVAPQMYQQTWFCILFAAIVGIAGGSFLGRSARIVRMQDTADHAGIAPSSA